MAGLALLGLLTLASLNIGAGGTLLGIGSDSHSLSILLISRIPRTLAVIFAGISTCVAAVIMQMLFRNRFVEMTTAGTSAWASLGLVLVALLAPGLPLLAKMAIAAASALAGTWLFLRIVDRLPVRSTLTPALVGLMLGGVVHALAMFIAYRQDLLQSLAAWTNGDFSGVLRGRYELLWVSVALSVIAYAAADRFTVAGLGEAFATNLGLHYGRIVGFGLVVVAAVTAVCITTAGTIPFLGLIVANLVSLALGDNLRLTLPWVALMGACFLLACDIVGRLIRFPYEIPVGTVAGVIGTGLFLWLLFDRRIRAR